MTEPAERQRRRPPRPGSSLGDVARLAGVSSQTVSRVARGEDTVRPETAMRVREAMRKLNYIPNPAARALRSGTFHSIGVVAHRISRTGEGHIVQAIIEAARAAGYTVVLVDSPSTTSADLSRAIAQLTRTVDGLVIVTMEAPSPQGVELPAQLPTVVGDFRWAGSRTSVGSDQADGTRQAIEHLLGLGHRTVHHVAGPATSVQATAREDAWRAALRAAGRPMPEPLVGDWSPASGYRAGRVLAAEPDATAIFCANDEMAQGVLRALHEAGRDIPGDVSVVGFDDLMAEYLWPPLTTVRQDFEQTGRELVRTLLEQIDSHGEEPIQRIVVPTQLVVRRSTGVARVGTTSG